MGLTICMAVKVNAQQPEIPSPYRQYTGKALSKALKGIGKREKLAFSYNPESIEDITVPDLAGTAMDAATFLSITLADTGFAYEVLGGVFVIFPSPTDPEQKPEVSLTNFPLSGLVRDRLSGEPLPYGSVAIEGTAIAATANSDGKFTLLKVPADTVTLVFRYIGYKTMMLSLNRQLARSYLLIEMLPQEKMLPSIQITGEKEELIALQSDAGHITFNPAEISKLPVLGEPDLFNALKLLPGVSGGPQSNSGISIRGSFSDQNLVMFDGISLYHIDHFYGNFSAFNSHVVKNVQLHKGGFGAEYGGRTAGVLNITGIEGNNREATLLAEINTMSINTVVEVPLVKDKASLVFAYRRGFTDMWQSYTFRNIFNNLYNTRLPGNNQTNVDVFQTGNEPEYYYYDLNTKVTFKPTTKDAISLSFYNGADDLQMAFTATNDQILRVSNDDTRWGNTGGSFKWSRKWNRRMYTYAIFGMSYYRSSLLADETFFIDQNIISLRFFDQRSRLTDYTLRLDNTYELNDRTSIDFGYWYTNYNILTQSQDQDFIFRDSTQVAELHALYLQGQRRLGIVKLKGGLRMSPYSGTSRIYFAPRLGISADITKHISLKATFGEYHQMIRRINERSLYFSVPEIWTLSGVSALPVLTSSHYMLGATWSKMGWQVDAELYYKTEDGTAELLFPQLIIGSDNLEEYALNGHRRIRGADLVIKRNFHNQNLLLSYGYLEAISSYPPNTGNDFFSSGGFPEHQFGLVYNYNKKRFDVSAVFTLQSGVPYTELKGIREVDSELIIDTGEINAARTELNHRLDFSTGYSWPIKKAVLQFGISVYNLYNYQSTRFIEYFIIPSSGDDPVQLGRRDVPTLGITPSAYIRLRI